MMYLRLIMVALAFMAGMLASSLYLGSGFSTPVHSDGFEFPSSVTGITGNQVLEMPVDRVREDQITVLNDRVTINIDNAEWSSFTPTKSMLPFIDTGANAIQVKPQPDCKDVEIGDVISYESNYADGTIIHRVIAEGDDSRGHYFVAKGDSNPSPDPGRIRCSQILRVLVAVIY